jgi:putative ABC transport system ATP-binding protein
VVSAPGETSGQHATRSQHGVSRPARTGGSGPVAGPGPVSGQGLVSGPGLVSGHGLVKSFRRGPEEVHALREVGFTLSGGELVALVGPSGSGKSTLLNVLCGWERPERGTLAWSGGLGGRRADSFGWGELSLVPQALGLLADLTLRENILLPARLVRRLTELAPRAEELMAAFGVAHLAARYPRQASLGEQQRCAVARALLLGPALLLADEPTAHQDAGWTAVLFTAFRELTGGGSVCLIATHDPQTWEHADRILTMHDGELREGRPAPAR